MVIAIVGATGIVGQTILKILHEKNLIENNELILYASKKHKNSELFFEGKLYRILELREDTIRHDVDFAIFSAGSNVSLQFAKQFAKHEAFVIDNSSAFRREQNVPLVIPEINSHDITNKTKIIANPNCSTIALALPLFAISKLSKIKRAIVTTLQAVSGAGKQGVDDLQNATTSKFPHRISNNIIPHIDYFLKSGYTFEEDKLRFETQKILHNPNIEVSATCIRIPITNCHSESVTFELDSNISITSIKRVIAAQSGIILCDDPSSNSYPMPIVADGKDEIFVGRIRKDFSAPNSYHMFLSMDNIRKGAALNAVQIMEYIIKNLKNKPRTT